MNNFLEKLAEGLAIKHITPTPHTPGRQAEGLFHYNMARFSLSIGGNPYY